MERGENNGVEIAGCGVQSTSGSVSLKQVKGPIFDFDNWERERSKCGGKCIWRYGGSYGDFVFLMPSVFLVMSKR